MKHYSSIPEKPLIAGMSEKTEPAHRVFFFERPDGTVFHTSNDEAWNLYRRGNQVLGIGKQRYKLIGTGDGQIFQKHIQEAKEIGQEDVKKAQAHIRKGIKEELEACRGRVIPPIDNDKMGTGASYLK